MVPSWSFPAYEGKTVKILICSSADEVELFLNGQSIGKVKTGIENDCMASAGVIAETIEIRTVSKKENISV